MHNAVKGHVRQRVAPAQHDPAWVAELKIGKKSEQESLDRFWSSSVGTPIHKFEQGRRAADVMLIYRAFKVVSFYITILCGLRGR